MANTNWAMTSDYNLKGFKEFAGFRVTKRGTEGVFVLYKGNKEIKRFSDIKDWDEAQAVGNAYVVQILTPDLDDSWKTKLNLK